MTNLPTLARLGEPKRAPARAVRVAKELATLTGPVED